MELDKEIPMLDMSDENFSDILAFNLWSEGSSSDYRNDRERPYNGQSWTSQGERGKHEVTGLTMRDIRDCLIKAMLISSPSKKYLDEDFSKCWDFSKCDPNKDGDDAEPTQFLIEHQNEPDFISTKVILGTWRPQDVYKVNWNENDPLAIANNMCCEIEKMMGIFPNIKFG